MTEGRVSRPCLFRPSWTLFRTPSGPLLMSPSKQRNWGSWQFQGKGKFHFHFHLWLNCWDCSWLCRTGSRVQHEFVFETKISVVNRKACVKLEVRGLNTKWSFSPKLYLISGKIWWNHRLWVNDSFNFTISHFKYDNHTKENMLMVKPAVSLVCVTNQNPITNDIMSCKTGSWC